jgi:hypothetical protein
MLSTIKSFIQEGGATVQCWAASKHQAGTLPWLLISVIFEPAGRDFRNGTHFLESRIVSLVKNEFLWRLMIARMALSLPWVMAAVQRALLMETASLRGREPS